MELTQLVLVKHSAGGKAYLYEAPQDAEISLDDCVVVRTRDGKETFGIAVAVTTVLKCSSSYRFISTLARAIEPLSKVVGKVEIINY